jgi:hypothetical protein
MGRLTRWLGCLRIRAVLAGKVNPSPRLCVILGSLDSMGRPADWKKKVGDDPGFGIPSPEHPVLIAIFARNPK